MGGIKMNLSVSARLGWFGALAVLFSALIGLEGYLSTRTVGQQVDALIRIQTAVRNQMEADMMHDAVRADVIALRYCG
jgi:methyl-accepting chemotaxis protein